MSDRATVDLPAAPPPLASSHPRRASTAGALLRAARPRQWTKNVLVFGAPAAAGVLSEGDVILRTLGAFAAFTLVSISTYLVNDVGDRFADRDHPVKRHRPIASGALSVRTALAAAVVTLLAGLALAAAIEWELLAIVAGYMVVTGAYTAWLKHVAVFDIAIVATGFFMRAVAGGLANDLDMSRWFLMVTAFGSLYIVAGKRYAEVVAFGDDGHRVRPSLAHYTAGYLNQVITIAAGVTILAFCLWAFEGGPESNESTWTGLSVIPFVLGVMRYGLLIERGEGGEPEELVMGDRELQVLGLAWVGLLVLGVYA